MAGKLKKALLGRGVTVGFGEPTVGWSLRLAWDPVRRQGAMVDQIKGFRRELCPTFSVNGRREDEPGCISHYGCLVR
jgi:hypothetical protein